MLGSIFEFTDYKAYLRAWIAARPRAGHGEKSRIAEAASCHLAYVSQVLNASAHFSAEQLVALSDYLGQNEEERDYFLLLLSRARAGSRRLERFYDAKI